MNYLKNKVILFLLAFIATIQVGLVFRTERLIRTVEAFEPVVIEQVVQPEVEVAPEPVPEPEPEVELESLGEYRITAYCACEICCGEWALNRPNGIVYGAAGVELEAGVSCASPLPFGTVVEVEGLGEYVVQDRTAQWVVDKYGENLIDIYFSNHDEALSFGLKYAEVYKVVD